jgi:hypothetical protein
MRLLGITDCVNTCDCCGKTDLKCTVAFEQEDSNIVYYGRICAQRWYGKTQKVISSELKTIKDNANSEARKLYRNDPIYAQYEALLKQLNEQKLMFNERWSILRPVSELNEAKRKEISQLIANKYMLKTSDVYVW